MRSRTAALAGVVLASCLATSEATAQPDGWTAVVEAVRAHDDRLALRRLEALSGDVARRSPRGRYLAGRLHERLGEHEKAARVWEGLGEGLPAPIAEDVRFRRARALARSGGCERALEVLDDMARGRSARAASARALRARCTFLSGDLAAAVAQLRAVAQEDARGVDTFAVRLDLAEALVRSEQRAQAIAELRALLVDRPDHPDAGSAEAQLEALGSRVTFTADERMARAERLIRLRRPADAITELDAVAPPREREARARYLHLRGNALFDTRHAYPEAATVLAQAARIPGPHVEADEIKAARALLRADRDDAAIRAYRRFVRRHPTHAEAGGAEYMAAWIELRRERAAGRRNMRRFLDGPRARGNLAKDAAWDLAFSAFERGRHREAAELFERYAQLGDADDAMVRGRGLYWLGRARGELGDRDGAVGAWRAAIAVEPLHWYALLARQRITEAGEDPGAPFPDAPPGVAPPALADPTLPPDVAFFHALGLDGDAVSALRGHEEAISREAPDGRELEAIVAAYRAVGAASRPYRLVATRARDALRRAPDAANRWAWEAAYPRPFSDEVERVARAHSVQPEHLWAIMRQESGYDPEAVSYADAIGLLQLLPTTAAEVARRRGMTVRREMLFDPTWNLRLAAAYVGGLFQTFDRRAPLAIGAYNAGGHRMRRWLDESPDGMTLDRFVERIPYDQTRNYVRRVTTHLAKYLYLANPEGAWPFELALELPD